MEETGLKKEQKKDIYWDGQKKKTESKFIYDIQKKESQVYQKEKEDGNQVDLYRQTHQKDGGPKEMQEDIEEKQRKEEKPIWKPEKKTWGESCVDG